MSVIHYEQDEIIAMIAATWNRGSVGSSDAIRYMDYLAEAGNRIMAANAKTYAATYCNESVGWQPITGKMIKGALIQQTVDKRLRGLRTLDGIRYNLIANNGQDFASAEILDDLLGMMTARVRSLDRTVA